MLTFQEFHYTNREFDQECDTKSNSYGIHHNNLNDKASTKKEHPMAIYAGASKLSIYSLLPILAISLLFMKLLN